MKITMDKRIDLVNGFDLEIKKVRPQDGGDYVCQLSTYTPEEQVHTLEILGKNLFENLFWKFLEKYFIFQTNRPQNFLSYSSKN